MFRPHFRVLALILALSATTSAVVFAYQATGDKPAAKTGKPRSSRKTPEQIEAANKAIWGALAKSTVVRMPNSITLEDALEVIKKASQGPNDAGIPIYINGEGLDEVGLKINTLIRVVPRSDEVPLWKSLECILVPHGLDFEVEDGMLTVSSRKNTVDNTIARLSEKVEKLTERLEALEKRVGK